LAAMALPGLLEADGSGAYNRVFDAVVADSKLDIALQVMPLARAIHEYNAGNFDGLFPGNIEVTNISTLHTKAFNRNKLLVFSRLGKKSIKSLSELNGKRVGIVRGVIYIDKYKNHAINFHLVKDEVQNIKMLLKGRNAAFMGLVPDTYIALQKLKLKGKLTVDKSIAYDESVDTFMFKKSAKHKRVIEKLNTSIKKLIKNGAIQQILGDAYVE